MIIIVSSRRQSKRYGQSFSEQNQFNYLWINFPSGQVEEGDKASSVTPPRTIEDGRGVGVASWSQVVLQPDQWWLRCSVQPWTGVVGGIVGNIWNFRMCNTVRGERFVALDLNVKVLEHCVVSRAPELRLQYVVKRGSKTVVCRDRGRWNL